MAKTQGYRLGECLLSAHGYASGQEQDLSYRREGPARPEYPEWDDPQWVRWQLDHLGTLPTHPQEVVDNTSDIRHLTFLHGSGVRWYENEVDGHILHQRQGGQALSGDVYAGLAKFSTLVRYVGPALLSSRFFTNDRGRERPAGLSARDTAASSLLQLSMHTKNQGDVRDML